MKINIKGINIDIDMKEIRNAVIITVAGVYIDAKIWKDNGRWYFYYKGNEYGFSSKNEACSKALEIIQCECGEIIRRLYRDQDENKWEKDESGLYVKEWKCGRLTAINEKGGKFEAVLAGKWTGVYDRLISAQCAVVNAVFKEYIIEDIGRITYEEYERWVRSVNKKEADEELINSFKNIFSLIY